MFKDPVVGERFFGRGDELAVLDKRVDALMQGYRQNVAITGHRLTGKSSLLNQFLTSLRSSGIIPIYIEVAGDSFRHFATKFIGILLYNYLKYSGREPRDDFDYLLAECRADIPGTTQLVEKIMKLLARNDFDRAYSELLSLSSVLKGETKKPCVVILDEFHNLSELGLRHPYKDFGRKIMTQKDTMYVVASSEVNAIKNILSEKLSLLFGNFEQITLSGFDHATGRAFLAKKFARIKVPPHLTDFIIAFADGHPFYLDAISTRISELMGSAKALWVSRATVARAMEGLIFNASGIINQFFNNFLGDVLENRSETARETLAAVASGRHKIADIARFAGAARKKVSDHMDYLIRRNLLYKSGDFFLFHDKVLEFWLREVSYKRRKTLIDDRTEQSRAFTALIESMIAMQEGEADKPLDTRLRELLEEFNNGRIEIDGKRHILPCFDSVEMGEDGRGPFVIGRYGEKYVVAAIRHAAMDENGVLDFLGVCYNYRERLVRKILVPLSGMEPNARLMAKEARVWVWGLESVNMLMDIFGKKRIVMDRPV